MSDTATQPETAASTPEAAASAASAAIQKASESSAAAVAAKPKPKLVEINMDSINAQATAAIAAVKALQAGGDRKYTGKTVEECIDEGVKLVLTEQSEEEKKKLLSGTTGEVAKSVASSGISKLFGETAGNLFSAGSAAVEAKGTIDMVKKAQAEADHCIGEAIATGSVAADIFKNRKEASTASVAADSAKSAVSSLPFVGGLFGGGKKKEEAPVPAADPTKVDLGVIQSIAKKQGASR